jgi:hypothetical protein
MKSSTERRAWQDGGGRGDGRHDRGRSAEVGRAEAAGEANDSCNTQNKCSAPYYHYSVPDNGDLNAPDDNNNGPPAKAGIKEIPVPRCRVHMIQGHQKIQIFLCSS